MKTFINAVCPWWMGYFLLNPLRRLWQNPEELLKPYVREGMRVLEIGPGMGFFTLTLARLSGPNGKVIGVDLQERMLAGLRRRADKTGLSERIETRKSTRESLNTDDLAGSVDFVLAFAVVHEIPDQERLYRELYAVLKPKALVFIAEPGGIISEEAFDASLARAEERGFVILSRPFVHLSHGAILSKE